LQENAIIGADPKLVSNSVWSEWLSKLGKW
jgi:hypothetical protein